MESSDRQQKMLELELENQKQLVDDLKKEIERIESDYRKQVSASKVTRKQRANTQTVVEFKFIAKRSFGAFFIVLHP